MDDLQQLQLPYDREALALPVPAGRVGHWLAPAADLRPALTDAQLQQALASVVPACGAVRRVTVVVPDITRSAGVDRVLPVLLEQLAAAGLGPQCVTVVIALGIHRGLTDAERRAIVGEAVYATVRVEDHDCRGGDLVEIGRVDGTPVRINRRVAEADVVLLLGTTTFHYVAGYGGARKLIVPGTAAFETAVAAHRRMLDPTPGQGWHPRAQPGVLAGNPVHEWMQQAADLLPDVRALTTLKNCRGEVCALYAGTCADSLAQATADYDRLHRCPLPGRLDVLLVSAGGAPRDINLIQSHKALAHTRLALAPGGTLVLFAACPDGLGYPTFGSWFDADSPAALEALLRTDAYEINGQTAYSLLRTTTTHDVVLYSCLPDADVRRMRMIPVHDWSAVARFLADKHGPDWTAGVAPSGGAILPEVG